MTKLPLLLLLVAGVLSAPYIRDDKETLIPEDPHCDASTRFKDYVTSVFDYLGESENAVEGSSKDKTGMRVTATVHIKPVSRCVFSMQIKKAELSSKSKNSPYYTRAAESKKFSKELEAQQLLFRVTNGEIVAVLSTVSEKAHVLNIKRGILSTLQLGDPTKQEVESDVNGVCSVSFVQKGNLIVKSKNLTDCNLRTRTELGVQSASLEQSDLPLSPLKSTSKCNYQVDRDGKIVGVECKESHLFRPFSAGYETTAGAITSVLQSMILMDELPEDQNAQRPEESLDGLQEEPLVFSQEQEHTKPLNTIVDKIDAIMGALVDHSDKKNLAVKQNYAYEFSRLVALLRKLDRKRMTPVWDKYFDCTKSGICRYEDHDIKEVYKQYLLDALTYCGTPTCVYMVHNVIVDEAVTGERMNLFLQGVAVVSKPTKEMIRDITNIARRVPSRQAFLTLGTLVYRFCNANPEECSYERTNPVTRAESFLEEKLGRSCEGQENVDRVEELMRTLKAIGNSGRPIHAWATLLRCAQSSVHQNVSIAALEAMRRMPCSDDRMMRLHEMLEDVNTDPEIRIHTFLALMKCPKLESLRRFVDMLEYEKSKQLTSFMYSHLKNIIESSNPAHADTQEHLKRLLTDKTLKKPELDFTKYSSSLETSLHSKWLKSGIATEGHIIFHPESYLPRSALLNFTADVMGVPINVLEMAIRIEGLQTIIEDVFGPNGVMPDNSILKLFNLTITKEDFEKAGKARGRRNADWKDNVDMLHNRVNKKRVKPSGDLSVKMFGHDVKLISYDDFFWMIDQIDNMNVIQLLMNLAKGGHKTFTKSFMFLEMTQTVPTGLGFPLKLKLAGTGVVSMELDGKFDIRNMFWGPSQMELKGFIRPSGVAEISGKMGIESRFLSSGMMVRSSAFTSQMLKGGIVYKEGELLKVNLDTPEDPVTLFNISTAPYLYVNEDVKMITGVSRRISPNFCLNDTVISGLGLCTSFAVPVAFRNFEAPYFPLSGPAHYGMKLVKADKTLTSYQLKIEKEKTTVQDGVKEIVGKIKVGAVGATYAKEFMGLVRYKETEKTRSLTVRTVEGMKRKAELHISHDKNTNGFAVEVGTDGLTPKPVSFKFSFFNEHKRAGLVGFTTYVKYGNQKIEQTLRSFYSRDLYRFSSKTTYWPGKHLTGEIEYIPSSKAVNVRLNANQFSLAVGFTWKIVNTKGRKGLQFTAKHLGRLSNVRVFAGYVAKEGFQKVGIEAEANGKTAEVSLGLYTTKNGYEVRMTAEALEKKLEIFSNYNTITESKDVKKEVAFGARYGGKTVGVRAFYKASKNGVKKDLCGAIFNDNQEPIGLCLSLDNADQHKRATVIGRILDKSVSVVFSYEKISTIYSFNTTLLYNNRVLAQNAWFFKYDGIFNSDLRMISKVGGGEVMVRWFSETRGKDTLLGVEARAMKNVFAATATYSSEVKDGVSVHGLLFQVMVNKKLPVDFDVVLELGSTMTGLSTTLNVMKYKLTTATIWTRPGASEYSLTLRMAVKKENFVIFGFEDNCLLMWSDSTKSIRELFKLLIWGKTFEFGWHLRYLKGEKGDGNTYHDLTYGLTYGKGKSMSLTTTYLNGKEYLEIYFTFRFLKNRQVVHSLVYNKVLRELKINIEFLPKMFVKLMARLDKDKGWKMTTDLRFDWKNMNKALEWIAKYTDDKNLKGLSFQWNLFGKQFKVKGVYDSSRKTYLVEANVLGKAVQLVGGYNHGTQTATLQLVTIIDGKTQTWITALVSHHNKEYVFQLETPSRVLLRTTAAIIKENKSAYLELTGLGKQLAKIDGQYLEDQQAVTFELKSLFKRRLRITAKFDKDDRTVFLHFDGMKKNMNIGFAVKYDPIKMSFAFSVEVMNKVVGVMVRADYKNYVLSSSFFFNDRVMGWEAYVDPSKKALVFNVTLSPTLSGQTVVEIVDDHIVKFTIQRKSGNKIINETTFKYSLMESESKFILQLNKDTVAAIKSYILPVVKRGYSNANNLAKNAMNSAKRFAGESKRISENVVRKIIASFFTATNTLDQRFDEFDFIAARDEILRLAAMVPVQASTLAKKSLLLFRDSALAIHDSVPVYLNQILHSKEKLTEFALILGKVTQNITGSAKPVVHTAIKLARDFKIRGKSIEEIVRLIVKYLKEQAQKLRNEVKVKIPMIIKKIKSSKLPYIEKNVGQLYNEAINQLKDLTFNYDMEKTMKWLVKQIAEVKILEKTVEEYIAVIEKNVQKLPAATKIVVLKAVRLIKQYITELKKVAKNIRKFTMPLRRLINKARFSVVKHYSPLAKKLSTAITQKINNIYSHLQLAMNQYMDAVYDFAGPLLKPFKPAFKDIVKQISNIRVMNKKLGNIVDDSTGRVRRALKKGIKEGLKVLKTTVEESKMVATRLVASTPEEIVEELFSKADQIKNFWTTVNLKSVIFYSEVLNKVEELTKRTIAAYKSAQDYSFAEFNMILDKNLRKLASFVEKISNEAANIAAQVAYIDVISPFARALKAANVDGHLAKYGINAKFAEVIQKAKEGNLTEFLMKSTDAVVDFIGKSYKDAVVNMEKYRVVVEKLVSYLASASKKDFETFYQDVASVLYANKEKITSFLLKRYHVAYARATKMYHIILDQYEEFIEKYLLPVKYLLNDVKEKTMMIYDDIKYEAKIVYNHYKTIVLTRGKALFTEIKGKVLKMYKQLYSRIVTTLKEYEGKTLEEIGELGYRMVKEIFEKCYEKSEMLVGKYLVRAEKMYRKLYKKIKAKVDFYYNELQQKLVPRIVEIYERASDNVNRMVQREYGKAMEVYQTAYSKANEFYSENKDLTIEELYKKGERHISNTYKRYYNILSEKVEKVLKKSKKVMIDVVLPELKKEMESVFNQTLRSVVVLGNKTVESFSPQYQWLKDEAEIIFGYGLISAVNAYKDSKWVLQNQVKELIKLLLKLFKTIKEHPTYRKYEKMVREHSYVKVAIKQYHETVSKLDAKYQEILQVARNLLEQSDVKDLKNKVLKYYSHPKVLKAINILREMNSSLLYTINQLKPKVTEWLQMTRNTLETLPAGLVEELKSFVRNPEEYVWSTYRDILYVAREFQNVDFGRLYRSTRNDLIGVLIEVTDLKTKEMVMDGIDKILDLYKEIRELPKKAKAEYARLVQVASKKIEEVQKLVQLTWDGSAVKPIITHEVWSEMMDDVASHELVSFISQVLKASTDLFLEHTKKARGTIIVNKDRLKKRATDEFERAMTTVEKFVKETKLKDIVSFFSDKTVAAKANLMEQKRKVEEVVKMQYAMLRELVEKYVALTVEKTKKHLVNAKYVVDQWKGKVSAKLEDFAKLSEEYKAKVEKALEEYREGVVKKANKVLEQYKGIMNMTLGELYEAPKMIASNINKHKVKLYNRYGEYKRRVRRYAEPYVAAVGTAAEWTVNELNETAMFIYKYYGMDKKARDLKDLVIKKGKETLPKIPGIVGDVMKITGKSVLKAIHTSMTLVDRMDLSKAKEFVRMYIPDAKSVKSFVNKYVVVDPEDMKLVVMVPHFVPVTPSFSYQVARLDGTARQIANKSIESAKMLIEAMRRRTEDLRRDLTESLEINKSLVKAGIKLMNKYKGDLSAMGLEASAVVMNETGVKAKETYQKLKQMSSGVSKNIQEAMKDVYASKTIKEMLEKAKRYGNDVLDHTRTIIMTRLKTVRENAEEMYRVMQEEYKNVMADLKPYYSLVKVAIEDMQKGKDFKNAFQHVNSQARKTYRKLAASIYKKYQNMLKYLEVEDGELASLLTSYKTIHRQIFGKYNQRLMRLFRLAKVFFDRGTRIVKTKAVKRVNKPAVEPFKSTATIFGKEHVMTFDGKVYKMPAFNKDTCTYLLARDFHSGNFTVLSQKEKIIISTPSMIVSISKNGEVKTTLTVIKKGFPVEKHVKGLPVQSSTGRCLREGAFVKCMFNSGLEVTCDVEHYACTIQLSGWHYAKTEGLLGSNNNEQYDDFKTPIGVIVTEVKDFVDSWELTGDPECIAERRAGPACNRAPSLQCKKAFTSTTSPLRPFFAVLDPKPFLKACEIESAACDNILPADISHCNTTAAYVGVLRAMGHSVNYLPQCAMYQNHKLSETWTVSPQKEVDIVVLVSAKSSAQSRSKAFASMIFNLHRSQMAGYNARYALIGFGGSGVHEEPHIVTVGGRIFVSEVDATTAIKEMTYTGLKTGSNDAYSAIRVASLLKFRPAASRIFILVNAASQMAHMFGPTLDETLYAMTKEADASLFVFDRIAFKNVGVKEKIIGQTSRKIYLSPNYRAVSTSEQLPGGPFRRLVQKSNGGIFSNKLKLSHAKLVTTALGDAIRENLRITSSICKTCTLFAGNAGEGVPFCRRDDKITC